jgi:APA family basic amino acid/polyamine antiporter
MLWRRLLVTKPVHQLMDVPGEGEQLKRVLGPMALVSLGVGAIIGAGIFVLTGQAAAEHAGPAIVLSFIIAGIGCAFAGLCYAEMASMIPVSGSAYTYSYATMGELMAWIIGWDLILEYSLGAATVSVGWSGYVTSFLRDFGIHLPGQLIAATGTEMLWVPPDLLASMKTGGWVPVSEQLLKDLSAAGVSDPVRTIALFNLPAVFVVAVATGLLVVGISESATANNVIVIIKVGVLVLFLVTGAIFLLNNPTLFSKNWEVFIPEQAVDAEGNPIFGKYGWSGVLTGAGVIFFAYIGFDAVSTAAQEAKNPQRDMPIGILGSLVVCTLFYIAVAVVLTGLVNYKSLGVADPVAVGIDATGSTWMKPIIKLGAIAGLSSVILVMLLAQPRIFYTMAIDGLLPHFVATLHPRFRTPALTTIITGVAVAIAGGMTPIGILGHLVSIGTLLAFVLVCGGVVVLRYTQPNLQRPFKAPLVEVTATLGILICLSQMYALPVDTWWRLAIWMGIGLAIYFCYGFWFSKLHQPAATTPAS